MPKGSGKNLQLIEKHNWQINLVITRTCQRMFLFFMLVLYRYVMKRHFTLFSKQSRLSFPGFLTTTISLIFNTNGFSLKVPSVISEAAKSSLFCCSPWSWNDQQAELKLGGRHRQLQLASHMPKYLPPRPRTYEM